MIYSLQKKPEKSNRRLMQRQPAVFYDLPASCGNKQAGLFLIARIFIVAFALLSFWGCATAPRKRVPPQGIYHIVGSGQTLYRIAKTYDVNVDTIMRANKISDPTKIGVGQQLFIPGAKAFLYVEPYHPAVQESAAKIVGPKNRFSRWQYITLHHSATLQGNAEVFDRNHRSRGMGGLFYHFVIGNGTGSGDGEIEVGWRWEKQTQVNRPNDIQICLVGNFNQQHVSNAQFESLVELVDTLRKQYNIPLSNIRRHKDIRGSVTECPGNFFPLKEVLAQLKKKK